MTSFLSYVQSWMPSAGPSESPRAPAVASSEHVGGGGGGPKIWPMAPQTAQELRKGVSFNMKIAIRGMRGTGKTTLFSRLCNLPTQNTYTPSQEISAGTIRIVGRGCAPHEGTKVDVWDVVDEGTPRSSRMPAAVLPSGQPIKNQQLEALAALPADARYVDVYKECHLAIFLIDPRRAETLSYAVMQAALVPPNICVYFLLNFADTDTATHTISARDMDAACSRVRRTSSSFIFSITEGRSVPTNLSIGASWTPLSALTGLGMRQVYLALNVPITVLRAAVLERQLQALHQQMQWPPSGHALSAHDDAHTSARSDDDKASSTDVHTQQGQPINATNPSAVLRLQHRRTAPPKRVDRQTDAHGIEDGFFGSSTSSEDGSDEGDINESRKRSPTTTDPMRAHGRVAADLGRPRERPVVSRPLDPSQSPAASWPHGPTSEAPPSSNGTTGAERTSRSVLAAVTPVEVAASVSDCQAPDRSFFETADESDDNYDDGDGERRNADAQQEDSTRLASRTPLVSTGASPLSRSYTVKPLSTQRVAQRPSQDTAKRADAKAENMSTKALTTVDVSELASQMQAALAAAPSPDRARRTDKKAAPERSRAGKSAKKRTPLLVVGETTDEQGPSADVPLDDPHSFEVVRD